MQKKIILEIVELVFEKSKDSQLRPEFFENVNVELTELAEYLQVTKMQALIVCLVFVLINLEEVPSNNAIGKHLNLNVLIILRYSDDFDALFSKGIIKKRALKRKGSKSLIGQKYVMNPLVADAITSNEPIPELKQKANDIYEVLEYIWYRIYARSNSDISTDELYEEIIDSIQLSNDFELINKIGILNVPIEDKVLMFYIIWKTINSGITEIELFEAIEDIFDRSSVMLKYEQSFLNGSNKLLDGYIEIIPSDFFRETKIKLSDNSINMLQESGIKIFENKKSYNNITKPEDIREKKLVFDHRVTSQVESISKLLTEENFQVTRKRLEAKGLPTGFACLFYGSPGTGKTEFAMQVARMTGRAIFKVEISNTKSMWFGESEKVIKRIFTDYSRFSLECDITPILFFNEADAILSSRQNNSGYNHSVTQTLNAMQNIILEEMENFKGILIATTNLENNLDSAFERRFLYKVQFNKPTIEGKGQIWKLKLPFLNEEECIQLARAYDFSGGQIENIVRKVELNEVIHGELPNFKSIIEFCDTELITKTSREKIGF